MNCPNRKKSMKNILLYKQELQTELKIQQLDTFPSVERYNINIQKIIHENNFIQSLSEQFKKNSKVQNNNKQHIALIQKILTQYYNPSYIKLNNQIQYNSSGQCLKRYYHQNQFQGKIVMLGQYYKYHEEQPRMFIKQINQIVQIYQEDKRAVQYEKVKDKIQEEKQLKQQQIQILQNQNQNQSRAKQTHNHRNSNNALFVQKKTHDLLNKNKKKNKHSEKILKNIQLSYVDFEKKPPKPIKNCVKIEKQSKSKSKTYKTSKFNPNESKQKQMVKSNSLSYKNILTKDIDLHKQQNGAQGQRKLSFNLKNVQNRENKNLQDKYTQAISDLFKKKRSSSSKTSLGLEKIRNKILFKQSNERKFKPIKQPKIQGSIQQQPSIQKNSIKISQNNEVESGKNSSIKMVSNHSANQKKIVRSKSHALIQICKSNKLLQTIKTKFPADKQFLKIKQNKNSYETKQSSKNKQLIKPENKIMKKWSSIKSIQKDNQGSCNNSKKSSKNIKVFEITKKDLASIELIKKQKNSSNKQSLKRQKYQTECQLSLKDTDQNYIISSSIEKQNLPNQKQIARKRTGSAKSTYQIGNKFVRQKEEIKDKENKVQQSIGTKNSNKAKEYENSFAKMFSNPNGMFERVLKSKIR